MPQYPKRKHAHIFQQTNSYNTAKKLHLFTDPDLGTKSTKHSRHNQISSRESRANSGKEVTQSCSLEPQEAACSNTCLEKQHIRGASYKRAGFKDTFLLTFLCRADSTNLILDCGPEGKELLAVQASRFYRSSTLF